MAEQPISQLLRAKELIGQKHFRQALPLIKEALAIAPDDVWGHQLLMRVLVATHRWKDALPVAEFVVERRPRFAPVIIYRSLIYLQLQRYADALQSYQLALSITPDDAHTQYMVGRSYENLHRYPQALEAYHMALELDPQLSEAWYQSGRVLSILKRYQEAADAFRQALKLKLHFFPWYSRGLKTLLAYTNVSSLQLLANMDTYRKSLPRRNA